MALVATFGFGKLIEKIGETTGVSALEKVGQCISEVAGEFIPSAFGEAAKDTKNPLKWFPLL